jgi:LPS sulfotransferase NodH
VGHKERFVILFEGRTGSTHLTQLLNSHRHIRARGEELRGAGKKGGVDGQIDLVRKNLSFPRLWPIRAVGFKTKLRDVIDRHAFANTLRDLSPKVIHMTRRNVIKHTVSMLNANRIHEATRKWNLREQEDIELPPIFIDAAHFEELLQGRIERERDLAEFIARLGLPVYEIEYDDLLRNEQAVLKGVFDLLGVKNLPTKSPLKKATSDDLREAIVNYDELRCHFRGTPYESMF